jgi:4-hydroxy-tetrahydrodipicolinate synthase
MNLGSVLTAMVTPFKDDFSVNYKVAQELADYLVNHGSDGLVVSGTTGESPVLSFDEKINLFKAVKEAVDGKAKVIAGTGTYSTSEAVELTKEAEKVGVDACMLVVPYYNKPPQEGLYQHFKTIAESTSLPIILYNVPSRTARNLEAMTTIRLAQIKNIVAIKEASGNMVQVANIIKETPPDFKVYSGEDSHTFAILTLGGDGVISVASHIAGEEIKDMVRAAKSGDLEKARSLHLDLLPLFKVLFTTTNPIMVKAAVRLRGIEAGPLRLPLVEPTQAELERLKTVLKGLSLL